MKKLFLALISLLISTAIFAQLGNVRLGLAALYNNSGTYNAAIGADALRFNNGGSYNVALGWRSLYKNTTGYDNTAVGKQALLSNVTGYGNVAVGREVLNDNVDGRFNTGIGDWTLQKNTRGIKNTAGGNNALQFNTTGSVNAAWGNWALYSNISGVANTAVGNAALIQNKTGHYNVGVGSNSGILGSNNTSCTFLGNNTSNLDTVSRSYSMALGSDARITANHQVRMGSTTTQSIGGYVGWSNLSDGRYKKDVREDVKGLEFILELRPVTYYLDIQRLNRDLNVGMAVAELEKLPTDKDELATGNNSTGAADQGGMQEKGKVRYTGFIAQEVERAAQTIGYDFSGVDKPKNEKDFYGLRYAEFVVPLVRAVQEQQVQIAQQQAQIAQQQAQIAALEAQMQRLLAKSDGNSVLPAMTVPTVFPNPASDQLQVKFQLTQSASIRTDVLDAAGRLVLEIIPQAFPAGSQQLSLNTSHLPVGAYFVRLTTGEHLVQSVKFVVERR